MISIKEVVQTIINNDIEAQNGLSRGILNLSQYAREIQKKVEKLTKKNVSAQSIVVTLARLERKQKAYGFLPKVNISNLSVKSPIIELVYEKNQKNLEQVLKMFSSIQKDNDIFFSLSTSTRDIAIVASVSLEEKILKVVIQKPKVIKRNLSAVSVRFNEELVEQPNVGYALMHLISLRNITLDEVFSTYNEFTLVFKSEDLYKVLEALK